MNKELDFEVEDLGTASIETQGIPLRSGEPQGGHPPVGISDDD
jgi:hypothetical protein